MSTTVNYKGSELVEFENATKVLKTAGKYLEDDVTIQDESSSVTVEALNATENRTYEEAGKAYSPVVVNVTPTEPTLVKINKQTIKLNKAGYNATMCSVLSSVGSMNITGVTSSGFSAEYSLTRNDVSDAGSVIAFMFTDVPTSVQWYPDTHNSYVVGDRAQINGYWCVKIYCSNTTKVTDIPTQTINID